ncbi:KilA N domain-containing protein [Hirudovirus strain Sangsue]|uniref:Kila N-domain-containing protein n=1 Tax=Acanthamoeba polyphaga mimivirus TaxID=212035 RepID=A0A0G2Y1W4_MIMIV|nr:KilA N domain-containing protein [Hirudovirus strain Sangsue]AKI79693.1 kila N-domain-containing protein [Acanthamoeba polyphaga mimivirus]
MSKTNKKISSDINHTTKYGSKTPKKVYLSNKVIKRNKNDIRNISYKEINDEFSWGNYLNLKVIIMNDNGYINVTKLIQQANKEKKMGDWNKNKDSKNIVKSACEYTGLTEDKLFIIKTGGNNSTIRGTYAHPIIVAQIAGWASSDFAIKASVIINDYIAKQMFKEHEKIIEEKDKTIKRRDKKIDQLNNKMDDLLKKNDKMSKRIKRLVDTADDLRNQNDDMNDKLDVVCNDRVVQSDTNTHRFIIMKNNSDEEDYEYHSIRRLKNSVNNAVKEYKELYPDAEIIMNLGYTPNSICLWNNIKKKLKSKRKIKGTGSDFNLRGDFTEEKLIEEVTKIHNSRFER